MAVSSDSVTHRSDDVPKSGLPQQAALLSAEPRIATVVFNRSLRQLPEPIDVLIVRIVNITIEIGIAQTNHSSWFEHTSQFPQGFHRLGKMIQKVWVKTASKVPSANGLCSRPSIQCWLLRNEEQFYKEGFANQLWTA